MRNLLLLILIAFLAFACRKSESVVEPETVGRTDTTVEVPTANMNEPGEPFETAATAPSIPPPASTTPGATPISPPNPRAAQPSNVPPAAVAQNGVVDRMPPAELHGLIQKGQAIAVDVRYAEQYKSAHIPGALHIPFNEIAWRTGELPRDKALVFYCT